VIRIFGVSAAVTVAALVGSLILGGPSVLAIVAILIVLEVSLSFDNAVVNAKILVRMSQFWQTMFLTIGILIAVFGMRLVFPLVLVAVTADLGPVEVVRLALEGGHGPGSYAERIEAAHPAIAGFGGMFLMMLFLDWLFEDREHRWLTWLERPLARIGVLDSVSVIVALTALSIAALTLANGEEFGTVLVAGVLGTITYLLVNGLGNLFEGAGDEDESDLATEPGAAASRSSETGGGPAKAALATGKAGFFLFMYLEVLDASFSFDGVVGAFAISQDIFVIAVGLGVGAFWIRSLTVFLVRKGTLNDYVYLEHGAHWAIGALAVLLLVTIKYEVPEVITGLIGVGFILAAFGQSVGRNRKLAAQHQEPAKVHA
jgi:hypothetical protein